MYGKKKNLFDKWPLNLEDEESKESAKTRR